MVLNIHSDGSYASERVAKSRAAGHYFLGWKPCHNAPIRLNSAIYTLCNIMKFVASSTAEAELGTIFVNAKGGHIMQLTLKKLGHPQSPTPMHYDNAMAADIANGSVKQQRSRATEMRYFYICNQVKNG